MSRTAGFVLLIVASAVASPAMAITSKDVMEKMSEDQRFGYLTGLIDMLAFKEALLGNKDHAQCLSDAFYKDNAMAGRLVENLRKFPDKAPQSVVYLVMKKACGQ